MEYVVTVKPQESDKKTGKITKTCAVDYVQTASDSETPNFENEDGLIDTIRCSIDSSDKKLICK
jgi:hypothetical protein